MALKFFQHFEETKYYYIESKDKWSELIFTPNPKHGGYSFIIYKDNKIVEPKKFLSKNVYNIGNDWNVLTISTNVEYWYLGELRYLHGKVVIFTDKGIEQIIQHNYITKHIYRDYFITNNNCLIDLKGKFAVKLRKKIKDIKKLKLLSLTRDFSFYNNGVETSLRFYSNSNRLSHEEITQFSENGFLNMGKMQKAYPNLRFEIWKYSETQDEYYKVETILEF